MNVALQVAAAVTDAALPDTDNIPTFQGTREEWCERIVAALFPKLIDLGIVPNGERQVRTALAPLPRTKLGVCHASSKSIAGDTNLITVSTDQGEPLELVHTLLHEMLHAFDDCLSGHRGRWLRWANQIGIERVGHARGPIAERLVQTALREVGIPAAHVVTKATRRTQGKSQIKFVCPKCSGHAHVPAGAVMGGFLIGCVGCAAPMHPVGMESA